MIAFYAYYISQIKITTSTTYKNHLFFYYKPSKNNIVCGTTDSAISLVESSSEMKFISNMKNSSFISKVTLQKKMKF